MAENNSHIIMYVHFCKMNTYLIGVVEKNSFILPCHVEFIWPNEYNLVLN